MPFYYDVNGDNLLSPLDALNVINYLDAAAQALGGAAAAGTGDVSPAVSTPDAPAAGGVSVGNISSGSVRLGSVSNGLPQAAASTAASSPVLLPLAGLVSASSSSGAAGLGPASGAYVSAASSAAGSASSSLQKPLELSRQALTAVFQSLGAAAAARAAQPDPGANLDLDWYDPL